MEVSLTEEQESLAQGAVRSGRLRDQADAVRQGLLLWEERERERLDFLAGLDEAEESVSRGEFREIGSLSEVEMLTAEIEREGLKWWVTQQTRF